MRTIKCRYGNARLTEDQTLEIGIRSPRDGEFYVHARFENGNNFKTKVVTDRKAVDEFASSVCKQVKTAAFPFRNAHGETQFFEFNPNAATLPS